MYFFGNHHRCKRSLWQKTIRLPEKILAVDSGNPLRHCPFSCDESSAGRHRSLSERGGSLGPFGFFDGGVAYTLQMVGQKYAQPAVASVVMSMESVFAVLAGCILLRETMTVREAAGCVIMFAAVVLAAMEPGS
jgi:hypothetical protein